MVLFYIACLLPRRPGFDYRTGHISHGTFSLGLRWPWSSLFIVHWKKGTLMVPYFRKYWMIYGGPGFLANIWFGSSPTPFLPSPVSNLSLFLSLAVCRRSTLLKAVTGGEGWARSQIRRPRECLVLYKSFNTLCFFSFFGIGSNPLLPRPPSYPPSLLVFLPSVRGKGM